MTSISSPNLTLLLAFPGFEKELAAELHLQNAEVQLTTGELFVAKGVHRRPIWARVAASGAEQLTVASIGDAAKKLKERGRFWAGASPTLHRRAHLIQEHLGRDETRPLEFLSPVPDRAWGLWALLDENTLVAAPVADSPLPRGEITFVESKEPPSRAYLKLWETFTLHDPGPSPQEVVADFGSCPGGWTWVLAQRAKTVFSIDKAPLDPAVLRRPNVRFIQKDAFRLKPEELGPIDWFFSDIICEPARLLELVLRWQEAGVKRFVCTIKYKGVTDFETTEKFLTIPGSRVVHLCANKHEVTWLRTGEPASGPPK